MVSKRVCGRVMSRGRGFRDDSKGMIEGFRMGDLLLVDVVAVPRAYVRRPDVGVEVRAQERVLAEWREAVVLDFALAAKAADVLVRVRAAVRADNVGAE